MEQTLMSETKETLVPDNLFYQLSHRPHQRRLRHPLRRADPTEFAQHHKRLGYNNTQGHGYFAAPSAWVFEENGIILTLTLFKADASDLDTLSFDQAMADIEHVTKWMEAAAKEMASLEKNGTWKEVSVLEVKTKILPGTWVFQRKRSPDVEITKYKARYCF